MTRAGEPSMAVLITYHNEGPLLTECLESIARQTEAPDEILIYDDASTLGPAEFVPPGVAVRIIRGSANAGPGHGRNVLVEATSCQLVHFHDADDLFTPTWSSAVRAAFRRPDVDLVITEIKSTRGSEVVSESVLRIRDELGADPDLIRFCLRGALLLPSTTVRRALVRQVGGFLTREVLAQSEDFDFHVRVVAAVGSRYHVIPDPLIIIRLRESSHSSDQRAVWASAAESVRLLAATLSKEYHQDLSDAAARFASRLFRMGHPSDGRVAARIARSLGTPRFNNELLGYRLIAKVLGQELAERAARQYRRLLPVALRQALRK